MDARKGLCTTRRRTRCHRSEIIENWPMTLSVKWAEKKNIVNATRCATRLRLVLKEEPEQAKEKVAAMAGVITVVENSGQFQVVIGTHVGEVYDAVAEELHLDTENLQVEQPKQSVMNKVIATMSAVFAPLYIFWLQRDFCRGR